MQQRDRIPSSSSWGFKIYRGKSEFPKSRYSEDFHVRLVGTRKRALSKIAQRMRDNQGAREAIAFVVAHGVDHAELQSIFAWIGNDILRLPEDDYERIVGGAPEAWQEHPASEVAAQEEAVAPEPERVAEPPDLDNADSQVLSAFSSIEPRGTFVGHGANRRRVLPECIPVVRWVDDYPGISIRPLAQNIVEERGLDRESEEVKTVMGIASSAHKCGYVQRFGDRFYPLGFKVENAA
jgi:hypothetical protein